VLTPDQAYRLRLSARGSVLLVWVDDTLVLRADDAQTRRGWRVGLRTQNNQPSGAMPLRLDNWMVTR
jgi:hypothetical protein